MERINVYQILDGERDYQDDKWTESNALNGIPDAGKSVSEWLGFIQYHINKAKTCVYNRDQHGALAEMRKITALGVKAMEVLDCPERKGYERLTTIRDYYCSTFHPRKRVFKIPFSNILDYERLTTIRNYYCSTFHPRKRVFKIPFSNILDDEIDVYISKIAEKYKKNVTTTLNLSTDGLDLIVPDSDIFHLKSNEPII